MCNRHISPIKMAVYGTAVGCAHLPIWRNWSHERASVILQMLRTLVIILTWCPLHQAPGRGSFLVSVSEICKSSRIGLFLSYNMWIKCQWISLFTRTAGKLTATLVVHLRAWWHSFYEPASFLDPVYTMPLFSLCFAFFFFSNLFPIYITYTMTFCKYL